jgi:hypothetical protein
MTNDLEFVPEVYIVASHGFHGPAKINDAVVNVNVQQSGVNIPSADFPLYQPGLSRIYCCHKRILGKPVRSFRLEVQPSGK